MDNPAEGWDSCWRETVATSTCETQTDEQERQNQRTQQPKRNEVEVQTEDVAEMGATPMLRSGFAKLRELDAYAELVERLQAVLYCIILYCIVLYCILLQSIVLYCIVLYCIALYCIVLYCIVLYCIAG